jgi:hypothetical protein
MANALVPPLTVALRVVTGITSGIARWLANHKQLVTTLAQTASTVVTIGGVLAIIGKLTETIGGGFGLLAKIIPPIAGFLASPLGIVVAIGVAIAAGVAAWMRFTASGQAAAKMLLEYFAPAIEFIKQIVGGIGDALMAGNLALAGRIALKGLEIIFAEGINTIADLIGGTLGDTIGQLADQITSGDFAGAWQTAVAGMAKLWADFSSGVVTVFTSAAKAVVDVWAKTVSGSPITFRSVGPRRRHGQDRQPDRGRRRRQAQRGKRPHRSPARHPPGHFRDRRAVDQRQHQRHRRPNEGLSRFGEAQAAATAADADRNLRKTVGPGGRRADVGRLNNELDGLTKQAAKERAGIKDVQLPDKASLSQVSVGFSGAALAMQLQGGNGPQQQLLDKAKKQVDLLTEARDALFKIKDKLAGFGFAP